MRFFDVVGEEGSPPGISVAPTSSCSGSDPTEITEYPVILDSPVTSVPLSPETMLSLLAPALLRVLFVLLSCPWLRRLEGPAEVLLLDKDFATSLSFRLKGFGERREVCRSRGASIEFTDGVD